MPIAGRAIIGLRRLLDVLLLALVAVSLGVVVLGRVLPLTGHQSLVVAGPSMGAAIPLGAAVILDQVPASDLAVGDVVTLRSGAGRAIFTHRIIRIAELDGAVMLETQGDANATPDPSLTSVDAVIGRVGLWIPHAGYLLTLYSAPSGVIFVLSLGMILLVLGISLEPQTQRRRDAQVEPDRSPDVERGPVVLARPASRQVSVAERPNAKEVVRASRERRARHALGGRYRASPPGEGLSRSMRARVTFIVAIALLLAIGFPKSSTLARFTDSAVSSGSFAADTLAPPTGLAATGGASVTLTWTPSVDTYATGYAIYRSDTSGGGFVLVSTATPGTAANSTDNPGPGTWLYVARTMAGSWDSDDSNEASAQVAVTSTTFQPCVSTAADTTGAGDNNGYESNPARACVSDGLTANDASTGNGGAESCGTGATPSVNKDRHRFWGYALGLPATVTSIDGIRVQATLGTNNNGGTTNLCAQLSWDGGATWTTINSQDVPTTADTVYTFGSTSDTWGRAWSLSELSAADFRVRLIDASSQPNKQFQLDYVSVGVTYTP